MESRGMVEAVRPIVHLVGRTLEEGESSTTSTVEAAVSSKNAGLTAVAQSEISRACAGSGQSASKAVVSPAVSSPL